MDGLVQMASSTYQEISVGGKTYRLAPPRIKDLAAVEVAIQDLLPDPILKAAQHAHQVPAEQQTVYWQMAFQEAGKHRRFGLNDMPMLPLQTQMAATCFLALQRWHNHEIRGLDAAFQWLEQAIEEHGIQKLSAILAAAIQEVPSKKAVSAEPEAESEAPSET